MNLIYLYFSASGRINRSTFWLQGILLLTVIWVFLWALWAPILFWLVSVEVRQECPVVRWFCREVSLLEDVIVNPQDHVPLALGLLALLVTFMVVFNWNFIAVSIKRLHDRNKPAWWLLLWYAISLIGGPLTFGIASLAVAIWAFIELGCLEGTRGRNRYGEATTQPYMYRQPGIAQQMPGVSPQAGSRTKDCPYCAETIMYDAVKCRYCRSDVPNETDFAIDSEETP